MDDKAYSHGGGVKRGTPQRGAAASEGVKRTSGAAFLAERDAVSSKKAAVITERRGGLFSDMKRETVNFREVFSSACSGARMAALANIEEEMNKLAQPRCVWWRLKGASACPLEDESAMKGRLDLPKLAGEAPRCYILIAEVIGTGGPKVKEHDADCLQVAQHEKKPWTVVVKDATPDKPTEVLRLRRPAGIDETYVWVVGLLTRTGKDADVSWKIQAINEAYPANRLAQLLPLRVKELLPEGFEDAEEPEEKKELTPQERAKKALEEAMKTMA